LCCPPCHRHDTWARIGRWGFGGQSGGWRCSSWSRAGVRVTGVGTNQKLAAAERSNRTEAHLVPEVERVELPMLVPEVVRREGEPPGARPKARGLEPERRAKATMGAPARRTRSLPILCGSQRVQVTDSRRAADDALIQSVSFASTHLRRSERPTTRNMRAKISARPRTQWTAVSAASRCLDAPSALNNSPSVQDDGRRRLSLLVPKAREFREPTRTFCFAPQVYAGASPFRQPIATSGTSRRFRG
jgi:hypothetical protein